ncbi:MAG: hypothetical protein KDB16_20465 [Acidimicrobiales bacterium]|nr:hypothetical protein [Acidimicrobiales bacterium]
MSDLLFQAVAGTGLAGFGLIGFVYLRRANAEATEIYRSNREELADQVADLRRELFELKIAHERLANPIRRLLSTLNGAIPPDLREEIETALLPTWRYEQGEQP